MDYERSEETVVNPSFSDDNAMFRSEVHGILVGIREELDDHRQAINENTNEVESHFEFLIGVSRRVDLLAERLDRLYLQCKAGEKAPISFKVDSLTAKEKKIFSALYSCLEDHQEATYSLLASRAGSSEEVVAGYVTNLMEKGVPVKKRYVNQKARLSLDSRFRLEQAKGNLVRLDLPLTAWL